jgi:hypothetical protein
MNRPVRIVHTVEFIAAGLITAVIVALHGNVLQHAGPLWRDEISTLRLATMPTFAGFSSSLIYDPMPALFFVVLRAWNLLYGGAAGDDSLRFLGLLIGLAIIAALWYAARASRRSAPAWAILLLGLSPVALVWGDSIRAYGLGCLFNLLSLTFIWKLVRKRPRPIHITLAALTALLSVQSLFSNSFLLSAAIIGAALVMIHRRWWRSLAIVLSIGVLAAVSLLPYAPVLRATQNWTGICQSPITAAWILTMMLRSVASGGDVAAVLWIAGAVAVCVGLVTAMLKPSFSRLSHREENLLLYAGFTLLIGAAGIFGFFRYVGWATSLWYYLPLMTTAAFCMDAIGAPFFRTARAAAAQALLLLIAAGVMAPVAYQATRIRLTNVDLVADEVARRAQADDLVVVDYYFYAISFNRYYQGKAHWVTVPNVSDVSLHRWDLLAKTMDRPQPVKPVLNLIERTLQAGHDVYVVGLAAVNRETVAPADLPPVGQNGFRRILWPYVRLWASQVAYTAQAHAVRSSIITIPLSQPSSTTENIRAMVVSGWNDKSVAASR